MKRNWSNFRFDQYVRVLLCGVLLTVGGLSGVPALVHASTIPAEVAPATTEDQVNAPASPSVTDVPAAPPATSLVEPVAADVPEPAVDVGGVASEKPVAPQVVAEESGRVSGQEGQAQGLATGSFTNIIAFHHHSVEIYVYDDPRDHLDGNIKGFYANEGAPLQSLDFSLLEDSSITMLDSNGGQVYLGPVNPAGSYTLVYRGSSQGEEYYGELPLLIVKYPLNYSIVGNHTTVYNNTVQEIPNGVYHAKLNSYQDPIELNNEDLMFENTNMRPQDVGRYPLKLTEIGEQKIHEQVLKSADAYDLTRQSDANSALLIIEPLSVEIIADSCTICQCQNLPEPTSKVFMRTDQGRQLLPADYPQPIFGSKLNEVNSDGHNQNYENMVQLYDDDQPEIVSKNYILSSEDGMYIVDPCVSSLQAEDFTMHVGDPAPTAADFQASAIKCANSGEDAEVAIDLSKADLQATGEYDVKVSSEAGDETTVTLFVLENGQRLEGDHHTMYVGDSLPSATSFSAMATDKTGAETPVMFDLDHVDFTTPGSHDVELRTACGQRLVVQLHLLERPLPEKPQPPLVDSATDPIVVSPPPALQVAQVTAPVPTVQLADISAQPRVLTSQAILPKTDQQAASAELPQANEEQNWLLALLGVLLLSVGLLGWWQQVKKKQ